MQDVITNIFSQASEKAATLHEGNFTYIGPDGLRRCKFCEKKLETILHTPHIPQLDGKKVNCVCNCDRARQDKIRNELKQIELNAELPKRKAECFGGKHMQNMTFDVDDSPLSEAGKLCRRWVMNYDKNATNGNIKWLFIYGGFGTGKSFYAAAVANAMIESGHSVRMATAADYEAEISASQDKEQAYKLLSSYDLIILDDFGSERKTDYMFEVIAKIVNDRYNARKAMLITSNMTTEETGNPTDMRARRIMERIWEMGYPIEMQGESRRKNKYCRDGRFVFHET